MSQTLGRETGGDLAVGRNVTVGGSGTVRGSLFVGHSLTVGGWLEARNIKGPAKGVFRSAEQLRNAYPLPHEGWWALVTVDGTAGDGTCLVQLYVADGGEWVAAEQGGSPLTVSVDFSAYKAEMEAVQGDISALKQGVAQNEEDIGGLRETQAEHAASLGILSSQVGAVQGDISALKQDVAQNKEDIASVKRDVAQNKEDISALKQDVAQNKEDIASVKRDVAQNKEDISALKQDVAQNKEDISVLKQDVAQNKEDIGGLDQQVNALQDTTSKLRDDADGAKARLDALEESKGDAGGIAPLGSDGRVPAEYLPERVDDVLEFGGMEEVARPGGSVANKSTDAGCSVVWDTTHGAFVLAVTRGQSDLPLTTYYRGWSDSGQYGTPGLWGVTPHGGKLFVDVTTNTAWRWNGATLAMVFGGGGSGSGVSWYEGG